MQNSQDSNQKNYEQSTADSLALEPSLKFRTLAWLDTLPPEERRNFLYNRDTEDVIDLRTDQILQQESIVINKTKAWNDYWKQSQQYTLQLLKACKKGNLEELIDLFQQATSFIDINAKDQSDWSCIHIAASLGQVEILKYLISMGASINDQDCEGQTALILGVRNNYKTIVDVLLENRANPNLQDFSLNTPLHLALENNNVLILNSLLKHHADPNVQNDVGLSPLQLISTTEQLKLFETYGYKKQMKLINYDERSKADTFSLKARKSVSKVMKFLGSTVSTYELQQEFSQKQFGRASSVPIDMNGNNNISHTSFIYHKELGKGSFGVVYLVSKKDEQDKLYAMKVLKKEKISAKLLPYIQTEKSILGCVDHPFIVKLHYAFQTKSKLFLVMDFCSGGDLTKLLDLKNKLPEEVARMYVCEIILALEALHKNKIMYRDMKPQNVIIDSQGHCMLTDFGLAKTNIDITDNTKSFCGTPAYMAPEVVNKKIYNRSIDWYQLGAITHEMLFGIPPFYSHNREELFDNIKNKVLKFPSQIQVSKDAQSFMLQILDRNPSKRLGSKKDAEEVRQHPWFKNVNWNDVYEKKLPVPAPSFVNSPNTIIQINFDDEQTQDRKQIDNWTFIS